MTLAGHKFHAPKGVGALYVRPGTPPLHPLLHGGGQEYGRRPGTENTLLCVALGRAAELAHAQRSHFVEQSIRLRRRLLDGLVKSCGKDTFDVTVPADSGVALVCNTLHLCFKNDVKGADLIREFGDRLLASGQSACKTGSSLSHVLKAMHLPEASIRGALRLSIGRTTTIDEIDRAVEIVGAAYRKLTTTTVVERPPLEGDVASSKTFESASDATLNGTNALYLDDTDLTTLADGGASVTAVYSTDAYKMELKKVADSCDFVVVLDVTIFHPQGGGQPSDVGTLTFDDDVVFRVVKVVKSPIAVQRAAGVIWHIGSFSKKQQDPSFASKLIGTRPKLVVDKAHRKLCARIHSAGHLIDVAMKRCGVDLRPGKGFHFLSGPYVEYVGTVADETKESLRSRLQIACTSLIRENIAATVHLVLPEDVSALCHEGSADTSHLPMDQKVRIVCVADKKGGPCGGTHVKSSGDILGIDITKIRIRRGNTRVSYNVLSGPKTTKE